MSWTEHLRISVNRDAVKQVYRLIREDGVQEWPSFLFSFILLSVVSAMTGLSAYLMKDVVNSVFVDKDQSAIFWVAMAVGTVFIVKGVATYVNTMIVVRMSRRIVARLQRRFFGSMLQQGMGYFTSENPGSLIVRFEGNAQAARGVIEMVSMTLWRDLFSLFSLVFVMFLQNPAMSMVTFLIGPPAALGVTYLMRKVKEVARQELTQAALVVGALKDTIDNIRVVKAYTLEQQRQEVMARAIQRVEDRVVAFSRLTGLTVPLMETLGGVAIALTILYGGYQVTGADSNPGEFFSFITAFLLAYEPARRLARFNVDFQMLLFGVEMFYKMIDRVGEDRPDPDLPDMQVTKGRIELKDVGFSYGEEISALKGISCTFEPGTMTALVGPSGAGKSTIFAMLDRFYLPDEGEILIDGQDVAKHGIESIRRNFAVVTQDPLMFDGTIGENILLGRENATEEEMIQAAKDANAHDFIMELPQGYDTHVGASGGRLSGGQKQRLSIARAIVRDAPILLLDEATSALDTLSEGLVQEALARLAKDRTTVAIAHRLSTIFDADQILVMDRGQIVERGSHEELVKKGGLYQQLYSQQVERMRLNETPES